ncbi:MAG: M81 family metallopeptidase, partial [Methyloceanibacter sp.]
MQEISSFNPLPSGYEDFYIQRGEEMFGQRGQNTAIGGALAIFAANNTDVIPIYSARAGSAGLLSHEGWNRLSHELLAAVAPRIGSADGIFVSLHGAMGADGELDPEGSLLAAIRNMAPA